ncbi:hypothetical protein D3C80_851890 [compost metagenome]
MAQAIRPAAEDQAAQRESGEEGADAGGDGVDLDPHHQGKLLDPEHLVDQGRATGNEQQDGGNQHLQGNAPAGIFTNPGAAADGGRTGG